MSKILKGRKSPDGELAYTDAKIHLVDAASLIGSYHPHIADILDVLADLLLLASTGLEEGELGRKLNDSLKFSERQTDSLGNPLQVIIRSPRKIYFSPEVSDILLDLSQALRIFRDTGNTEDFFETLAAPYVELAPKRLRNKISVIEETVQELLAGSKDLREENEILSKKVQQLKQENSKLRKSRNKLRKSVYSKRRH